MLSEREKEVVKETVPVLQEKGVEITSNFYARMFKHCLLYTSDAADE